MKRSIRVILVCATALAHPLVAFAGHAWRRRYDKWVGDIGSRRRRTKALWHEIGCMYRLSLWAILRLPEGQKTGRPVLLIHGALTADPSHLYGLGAALGRTRSVAFLPLAGVDIVSHSMGGVWLRAALQERPALAAKIASVITLGTPHQGTAAARGLTCTENARAAHRRSSFLRQLPKLSSLLPQARLVTIAGERDFIVYPSSSSVEDHCESLVFEDLGHAGLLVSRRVRALVVDVLAER